jgi:hypothetical protein
MKFSVLFLLPFVASAAILPEMIGAYQRSEVSAPSMSDRAVWDEYGLKASETATYLSGPGRMGVTVWRLQDSTAALAAFDWQRPEGAKPSNAASLAAETSKALILVHGNYLLLFSGFKPSADELRGVYAALPDADPSPLPTLPGFLPSQDLVANSERYILGPASLEKFDSGIPPSVAAFHLGAEGQLGVFHSPKGDLTMALFSYPTHQIAMQKEGDFRKIPGSVVKRSGPLVAVVLSPVDADAAERVLARVRYEAQVTLSERVPRKGENVGTMIISIFNLTGILLVFCVIAGLFVGGFRTLVLGRRGQVDEQFITLHLEKH